MTCTTSNAQGCSLELDESPTVAWFSYLPTDPSSFAYYPAGSGWGAPGEDVYYTQAIEFAGGTPVRKHALAVNSFSSLLSPLSRMCSGRLVLTPHRENLLEDQIYIYIYVRYSRGVARRTERSRVGSKGS